MLGILVKNKRVAGGGGKLGKIGGDYTGRKGVGRGFQLKRIVGLLVQEEQWGWWWLGFW